MTESHELLLAPCRLFGRHEDELVKFWKTEHNTTKTPAECWLAWLVNGAASRDLRGVAVQLWRMEDMHRTSGTTTYDWSDQVMARQAEQQTTLETSALTSDDHDISSTVRE